MLRKIWKEAVSAGAMVGISGLAAANTEPAIALATATAASAMAFYTGIIFMQNRP